MKKIFYFVFVFAAPILLRAQNIFPSTGTAGIGTITPAASSVLEIKSTTQGLLIPRMTKTQRDAIASPAIGLMIYQTKSGPGFYYFDGVAWQAISSAGANTRLSNLAGLTALNADLLPNANNIFSLGSSSSGWKNIYAANGYYLGGSRVFDITGVNNTFLGTIYNTTNTGNGNTFTGTNAGSYNTTGSRNTTSGAFSLYQNRTGDNNSAYGFAALENNTSGHDNTATGHYALAWDNSGSQNTASGSFSLYSNTTGVGNVADGYSSLYNNVGGSNNAACGDYSLFNNTEGLANAAFGSVALYTNTTGIYNCAVGESALYYNQTGSSNVAMGVYSLESNTAGYENTASGYDAGISNTVGHGNTFYGSYADCSAGNFVNSSAFGNSSVITASNQVRIGNSSVTSIGGYANWTNISDGRVKKNIKQNVPGLSFINKLLPVTYNLDLEAADRIMEVPAIKNKDGKIIQPSVDEQAARSEKEKIVHTGFIAQDVEKAAKSLNYDFSGVDAAKNSKDLYGLRYSDFVVPLVKAVQELSKANDDKDTKIEDLQKQIDELKAMITSGNQQAQTNNLAVKISAPLGVEASSLEQNTPNPFSSSTIIHYTLPQTYTSAKIIITDKVGKVLKELGVSGSGKGSLQIDASALSSGAYQYSLYVNARLIDTKQMILNK